MARSLSTVYSENIICTLPIEVLSHILSHLDPDELVSIGRRIQLSWMLSADKGHLNSCFVCFSLVVVLYVIGKPAILSCSERGLLLEGGVHKVLWGLHTLQEAGFQKLACRIYQTDEVTPPMGKGARIKCLA